MTDTFNMNSNCQSNFQTLGIIYYNFLLKWHLAMKKLCRKQNTWTLVINIKLTYKEEKLTIIFPKWIPLEVEIPKLISFGMLGKKLQEGS